MRNLPRAQTGNPQHIALGIQAGLWRCTPSSLGFRMARNKSLFLRPRPGGRNWKNRKFAVPGDPTRLPRPLLLFGFGRAEKGRRSVHWVSVSRPLPVQNQHD